MDMKDKGSTAGAVPFDSVSQQTPAIELALGRIFRIASRPEQPGDIAEYERCRALILDQIQPSPFADRSPNYSRDRLKGAQGDFA